MAFNTTPGNAEYTAQGAIGVLGKYTGTRKYSLSDEIIKLYRKYNKLDNILMQEMKVVEVDDPEPKVLTMQEAPISFAVKSDDTDTNFEGDTQRISDTLAVHLQAGDVLMNSDLHCDSDGANYTTTKYGSGYSPETVIVQSVVLSGAASGVANVFVKRGNGFSAAAAAAGTVSTVLSEHKFIKMGNALADFGNTPNPVHFEPTDVQNYCQFVSESWSESESEGKLNVYGKMTMADKANMKSKEFMRKFELLLFHGRKGKHTMQSNRTQWMTGGIIEFVPRSGGINTPLDGTDRLINMNGPYDQDQMRENTEIIYRYGSDTKHWFCGGKFFSALYNSLEKFLTVNDEYSARYGWKVFELELGHGIGYLHRHPFYTDQATSTTEYAYDAAVVDIEYIKLMEYLPVIVKQNVQASNAHGRQDEIYRQAGLWRTFPDAHAYIYGITG